MYRGVKRALDFITALLALIVLSPLLAITALAVKLDSNGPGGAYLQAEQSRQKRAEILHL